MAARSQGPGHTLARALASNRVSIGAALPAHERPTVRPHELRNRPSLVKPTACLG